MTTDDWPAVEKCGKPIKAGLQDHTEKETLPFGIKGMKDTMLSKTSQSQNTDSITPHTKDSSTVTLREAESRA